MARDLGGFRQCLIPGCGARVAIREDRSGRIYYKCLGNNDAKKCGAEIKFGKDMGATLRAEIETEQTKEVTGDDASNSPGAGRETIPAQTLHGDQARGADPDPATGAEPQPEAASEPEPVAADEPGDEHWSGL